MKPEDQERFIRLSQEIKAARVKAYDLSRKIEIASLSEGLTESEFIALTGCLAALLMAKTFGWSQKFEDEFEARLIRRLVHNAEQPEQPGGKFTAPVIFSVRRS